MNFLQYKCYKKFDIDIKYLKYKKKLILIFINIIMINCKIFLKVYL